MDTENWKYIDGTDKKFMISNHGRVKSFMRDISNGYILSSSNKNGWYKQIKIKVDGRYKSLFIHRLVAEYFVPNPKNKLEVNHIDGDKQNNHYGNLEWVTRHENVYHAMRSGLINLTPMIKRNRFENPNTIGQYDINGNFIAAYANAKVASLFTGVCQRNILQVANKIEYKPGRVRAQAGGFKWKIIKIDKHENERVGK